HDAAVVQSQRLAGAFVELVQQLHRGVLATGFFHARGIEPVSRRIAAAAEDLVEAVRGCGHPGFLASRECKRVDPAGVGVRMKFLPCGGPFDHAAIPRTGKRSRVVSASHAWNINTSHKRAPSSAAPARWRVHNCRTWPGSK